MSLQRFVSACDNHGDHICPQTKKAFFDFLEVWKPHVKIHKGDLFDFRALRRKANENEKRESIQEDVQAGKEFLQAYKPNVWLLGNHDDRLWKISKWGAGAVKDLAQMGVDDITKLCGKLKTTIVPYGKRAGVFKLGDCKFLHGYYCGPYAARRHAMIYGKCIFGHVHAHDLASVPHIDGAQVARACPALCVLDQEYNQGQAESLRHSNGWIYGVHDTQTGETESWVARYMGGRWLCPMV
jgi:hypothetical protein